MSWKSRATPVQPQATTGSWKDRAQAVGPASPTQPTEESGLDWYADQLSWDNLKEAVSDRMPSLGGVNAFLESQGENFPVVSAVAKRTRAEIDTALGNTDSVQQSLEQQAAQATQRSKEYPMASGLGAVSNAAAAPAAVLPQLGMTAADLATRNQIAGEKIAAPYDTGSDQLNAAEILALEASVAKFGRPVVEAVIGTMGKAPAIRRWFAMQSIKPSAGDALRLENRGMMDKVADAVSEEAQPFMSGSTLAGKLDDRVKSAGQTIGSIRDEAQALGAEVDLLPIQRKNNTIAAFSEGGSKKEAAILGANMMDDYAGNQPVRSISQTSEILGDLADDARYDRNGPPTPLAQASANLRRDVVGGMEDSMRSVLGDARMQDYAKEKEIFGAFSEGERLLDKNLARQSTQNAYGFRDLAITKGISGTGGGLEGAVKDTMTAMAVKQLRERAGPTGAWAIKKLETVVPSKPAALKYIKVLAEASGKSAEALSSTLHILQQTDPEFRQMMNDENP